MKTIAETREGVFEGISEHGISKFLGIRYAEAPIRDFRFKPPRRVESNSARIEAKAFGASSYQTNSLEIFSEGGFHPSSAQSEDCLFLNVFAPRANSPDLPVMVWIHGGAFTSGAGEPYDATRFVQENNVIVITINYRLGVFGFVDFRRGGPGFEDSVNLGIQDQICALEWVRDNIAAFGGDPRNVTVWGESAGGTSVLALLGCPRASGLFHKVAAFSGAEVLLPALDQFDAIKAHFKSETDAACMERLTHLSGAQLHELQSSIGLYATPILDGKIIALPACEAISSSHAADIPVIAGTCRDEGTLLAPAFAISDEATVLTLAGLAAPIGRDLGAAYSSYLAAHFPDASPFENLTRAWFDLFRSSAVRVAANASIHGAGGWVFNFEVETDHELGITHFADVPFAFDWVHPTYPNIFVHKPTPENVKISKHWSRTLAHFAKTGDPNGGGFPNWPKYRPDGFDCLVIKTTPQIVSNPDGELTTLYKVPNN